MMAKESFPVFDKPDVYMVARDEPEGKFPCTFALSR